MNRPAERTWQRGVCERLDRRGFRWLLGCFGTLRETVRAGEFCRVGYRDGRWLHRFAGGVWPARRIGVPSPKVLERQTRDTFFHVVTPRDGDVVFDVGAGLGTETLTFARLVGSRGQVYAFEAHPGMAAELERLVALNKLQNVTVVPMAVTAARGPVSITDLDDHVSNRLDATAGKFQVDGISLDEFVHQRGIDRVNFLKMNIEGAERLALSGMTRTLAITRHVAISCHDFLAERGGADDYRTRGLVQECLRRNGFHITTRPHDGRDWIRDYLYGSKDGADATAAV